MRTCRYVHVPVAHKREAQASKAPKMSSTATPTIEIMINNSYGGFALSDEAKRLYAERGGECQDFYAISRHDPVMVPIAKELGPTRASRSFGAIRVVTIPARFVEHYAILEYDGLESVELQYNSCRVETAKAVLKDESLTPAERVARATAALEERFEGE